MKVIFIFLLFFQLISPNLTIDLDTYYKEYIETFGYKLEENPVVTDDGYILSLWHLYSKMSNGKIIFMQHGLADTAWTFFQLEEKSLPFLLLNEGYDVWLGNLRGNIFSNKHISKDPKESKSGYYDYSIDNFITSDLPAMVNFIKSKTGGKKMTYIGHSQGTTLFFMNVMHDPTFVEKSFESLVTIGTVPNIIHIKFAPIELLDKIYGILKALGIFNSFNLSNSQRKVLAKFCKGSPNICGKIFDILASIKPSDRMDYKNIYNLLYYFPGGVSKINLLHWSQIHKMKKLVYYNPQFHKEKTAKEYNINNLKKWKIKSLIARTDDDSFSSYQDVTDFYNIVENKSTIKILDLINYSHLDCLAAKSAVNEIYKPILNFLKS